MSEAIPIQRTEEELKQLERQYNVRRPMLTHVAAVVKSEIEELLNDEGFQARLSQGVLTSQQFTDLARNSTLQQPLVELTSQINLRVVARNADDIEPIRETIETHYQSVHEGWKADGSQLTLRFLIPPQAKPHGFRERNDLPNQMQVSIVASQSAPRMTTDGYPIPHLALIMKGGGIKGLAYVGALDLLRDEYDFSWFVGTSAGAITAILLATGYTVEEMQGILEKKNFKDFFDAKWYQQPLNFISKGGLHPAKAFTDWMDKLLAAKLGQRKRVTLGDIQNATGNRTTVYASQQRKKALTFDSVEKPDTAAAYAARCSMSIPIIFIPETDQGITAFDGGLQNNFPIRQLTEVHGDVPFVSLFLGAETFEPLEDKSVFLKVLDIFLGQGEDEYVEEYKKQTVVIDPRPIGTLDFDLSKPEKEYLVVCGSIGALNHLEPDSEELAQARAEKVYRMSRINEIRSKRRRRKRILRAIVLLSVGILACLLVWLIMRPSHRIQQSLQEIETTLKELEVSRSDELIPKLQNLINKFEQKYPSEVDQLSDVRSEFDEIRQRVRSNPSFGSEYVSGFLYKLDLRPNSWATVISDNAVDSHNMNLVFVRPYDEGWNPSQISFSCEEFESEDPVLIELWSRLERKGQRLAEIKVLPSGGQFTANIDVSLSDKVFVYMNGDVELTGNLVFVFAD